MAEIRKKRVRWTAAPDADVVSHRVRVGLEGAALDYGSPYVQVDMPETSIILPDSFPAGTFDLDQNYTLGISAVDDVGNEGDIVEVASPFDFVAPGVPTEIVVENI